MWKKVLLAVLLLLTMSVAYADNEVSYDNEQSSGSYPKVTQIEKRLYSKSYQSEDIYKRLDRIENSVFHKNFPTDDLATRMDNIQSKTKFSEMPEVLLNDIAVLEEANFNKIFKNDSPDVRLERLEYHLIGAVQDGNYKDRVYKLGSLDDQNKAAEYLDANSHAYDESYPKRRAVDEIGIRPMPKTTSRMQDILFMVAPFLFGLL